MSDGARNGVAQELDTAECLRLVAGQCGSGPRTSAAAGSPTPADRAACPALRLGGHRQQW